MKHLMDENFLLNKGKYIRQCILVTFFVGIILLFFNYVIGLVIVASLGATCFIVFTIPHRNASRAKYILGGYSVGALVGSLLAFVAALVPAVPVSLIGSLAIGISMFLMVVFNFEHPPAAAFSLGIVLGGFNIAMIISAFTIASTFLIVRHILNKWLIDLV